jgi:conjugal transfer pilus assembly protein TraF
MRSLWIPCVPCRLLGLFFYVASGFADPASHYYEQHGEGWHWYQDPRVESVAPSASLPLDPISEMKAVREGVERALDAAVLHPTPDNIQRYIVLQNEMSTRANQFSSVWQQILLNAPGLDYSISHPTNQLGREVYLDEQTAKENEAIHTLATHSGLFFFYRSTCPYCQRFAPIVKTFSETYGIPVVPITTDGIALPEFPDSQVDAGQSARFHVGAEPALFTVDPYHHQATPVSYGLLSESELRARILMIAVHAKGGTE